MTGKRKASKFFKSRFPTTTNKFGEPYSTDYNGNEILVSRSSYKKWPWKGIGVTTAAAAVIFIAASSPTKINKQDGRIFYLSVILLSLGTFLLVCMVLALIFYIWFLVWTHLGLEIPECCWFCKKIIYHELKHKKNINFHNEKEKFKGPTVWSIEEQIKKLPDHNAISDCESCITSCASLTESLPTSDENGLHPKRFDMLSSVENSLTLDIRPISEYEDWFNIDEYTEADVHRVHMPKQLDVKKTHEDHVPKVHAPNLSNPKSSQKKPVFNPAFIL